MKPLAIPMVVYTCLVLFLVQCQKTDPGIPVDIPDKSFLNALISQGIDINGDGVISNQEAEQTLSIRLE